MTVRKRSSSSLDDLENKLNKAARIETTLVATDALELANAHISELEHQVRELQGLTIAIGVARSKSACLTPSHHFSQGLANPGAEAPESIRRHLNR